MSRSVRFRPLKQTTHIDTRGSSHAIGPTRRCFFMCRVASVLSRPTTCASVSRVKLYLVRSMPRLVFAFAASLIVASAAASDSIREAAVQGRDLVRTIMAAYIGPPSTSSTSLASNSCDSRKMLRGKEVSQASCVIEKSQAGTRPGFLGEIPQWKSTACSIYFAVGAGAGATVSLCCAQAPSPKAVTRTATIMIIFRNFNLYRLLSSQVAPLRLGGESRRSNAFLHFFEPSQIGRPVYFA